MHSSLGTIIGAVETNAALLRAYHHGNAPKDAPRHQLHVFQNAVTIGKPPTPLTRRATSGAHIAASSTEHVRASPALSPARARKVTHERFRGAWQTDVCTASSGARTAGSQLPKIVKRAVPERNLPRCRLNDFRLRPRRHAGLRGLGLFSLHWRFTAIPNLTSGLHSTGQISCQGAFGILAMDSGFENPYPSGN